MSENRPVSLLADRYASAQMRAIFAPESKIISERKLWIAVMRAQAKLGHVIDEKVIADYEKVINKVDLASIDAREKQTRHDVKARIEEFNALAGHEAIHAGMTSRDLTENVEAMQVRDGLELARARELLRSSQWELERLFSRLFGQKQEVNVSGSITIGHALADISQRRLQSYPQADTPALPNNEADITQVIDNKEDAIWHNECYTTEIACISNVD